MVYNLILPSSLQYSFLLEPKCLSAATGVLWPSPTNRIESLPASPSSHLLKPSPDLSEAGPSLFLSGATCGLWALFYPFPTSLLMESLILLTKCLLWTLKLPCLWLLSCPCGCCHLPLPSRLLEHSLFSLQTSLLESCPFLGFECSLQTVNRSVSHSHPGWAPLVPFTNILFRASPLSVSPSLSVFVFYATTTNPPLPAAIFSCVFFFSFLSIFIGQKEIKRDREDRKHERKVDPL